MNDRQDEFAEQLRSVRPATRHVITSMLLDTWPNLAAIVDFGIDSQTHYEALYYPIRAQEIAPKDLDAALGDGRKLTALTRAAPSNPHKDVEFHTSWDMIFGGDGGGRTAKDAKEAFNEVLHGKAQVVESAEGELLSEIKELTKLDFVYEDGWCGMVPFSGTRCEMQTGPPVPFAELTWRDQADVLREFIHWDNCPARDWNDEYRIRDNIAAGKPSEQWLDGTSLRESFRLVAEGKTPPPAKEFPEITAQDLWAALAEAGQHASCQQAKDSDVPERASPKANTLQDILRNDQPREAETQTREWSGWEV